MNKILNNIKLPIIALFLIVMLYGGLNINKLQKNNADLAQKIENQALKIALLEDNLNNNIQSTESLKNEKSELEKQISNLKNQINYKAVLAATTEEKPAPENV